MKGLKKFLSMLVALLLLFSNFGVHVVYSAENLNGSGQKAATAADTPVIAMTHVPKYGGYAPFEGRVYTESGSDFSVSDYHVTLYLKQLEGTGYWVKPSEAQPFVEIDDEGHFSIPYTSGGDTDKTDFRILLLPADHGNLSISLSPVRLDALCEDALDYVTVKRTKSGGVTVDPKRYRFSDVLDSSHPYYKAIYWAAADGITKGYSDGTFGINRSCTRSEAVMFLWRMAGKPAPKTASTSPFKDVPKTHAHYKAILWGSQKGVTKGFSDGTFGINKNCTRGQIVTFLYRIR